MEDHPTFDLNPRLTEDTPAPAVSIAADWAKTFPLASSPYINTTDLPRPSILNLAQGVPGHLPSPGLLTRVQHEGKQQPLAAHAYTDVFGVTELRQAIAEEVNARYSYTPAAGTVAVSNVAVTAGANLAFAIVAQALAQHGDAIVLPVPWYFNHQMTLASLGIRALPLPTSNGLPSVPELVSLLKQHDRIKAVVVVSPNNPAGLTYPNDLLEHIFDTCATARIALVLDETYRDFVLLEDGSALAPPHDLLSRPKWANTLVSISSFSKSYAIPGHRLGFILCHPSLLLTRPADGDPPIFGPIAKALDNYQICPPRADTQRAVAWAISAPEEQAWRLNVAVDLQRRRDAFVESIRVKQTVGAKTVSLEELGWKVVSIGAYYALVKTPFTEVSSEIVARALAGLVGVVVLPGKFFMPDGSTDPNAQCIRVSIANVSAERLAELPSRLMMLTTLYSEGNNSFQLGT